MPPAELSSKLLPIADLLRVWSRPRAGRLVFTNGCFDILHRGHVEYLHAARALGDALAVGLNSDDSVRRLKGPGRPINPAEDRAVVLAGLRAVDVITIFDDDTPRALIRDLLPDVLVKGGDYQVEEIVGREEVCAMGGRVVVLPLVAGRSTTNLLEKMSLQNSDE